MGGNLNVVLQGFAKLWSDEHILIGLLGLKLELILHFKLNRGGDKKPAPIVHSKRECPWCHWDGHLFSVKLFAEKAEFISLHCV